MTLGVFGIRFQGAFFDRAEGRGSDALIEFKVEALAGRLIKDVHLEANPLVIVVTGSCPSQKPFSRRMIKSYCLRTTSTLALGSSNNGKI